MRTAGRAAPTAGANGNTAGRRDGTVTDQGDNTAAGRGDCAPGPTEVPYARRP
ncbi:hypothetical protein KNE206_03730 [Kitasatospora sp. NE20-6]